ncbi:MAG: HAD hydrolase-like protein [Oscillospiraceae bacterium]
MPKYTTVLFDFDGTLVDSSLGIFRSLQYAFKADGKSEPDFADLRCFIGPPLTDSFKEFYGYDDENAVRMVEKYRERYKNEGLLEAEVYKGIPELLKILKANKIKIATASSKPKQFIVKILKVMGLYEYFDYIGGIDFNSGDLTKKAIIEMALNSLNITDKSSCIMVGDRCFDIDGANGAEISSIGVLYGFGSEKEFIENKATYIANSPADIQKIILGG